MSHLIFGTVRDIFHIYSLKFEGSTSRCGIFNIIIFKILCAHNLTRRTTRVIITIEWVGKRNAD